MNKESLDELLATINNTVTTIRALFFTFGFIEENPKAVKEIFINKKDILESINMQYDIYCALCEQNNEKPKSIEAINLVR